MRAVKGLKPKGHDCIMVRGSGRGRKRVVWVPGWLVRPSLQGYRRKRRQGCRQRVVKGDSGGAQFGSAELEGLGGGPQ